MSRVSDIGSHALMLNHLNRSLDRTRDIQVQISTGKVGLDYSALGRDSQRLVSMEVERSRTDKFVDNNKVVDIRLQRMESVVAQLTELASDAKAFFVNAGHADNAAELDVAGRMDGMLQTVAGLLNSEHNGQTLFAGGRTDAAPVDLALLPADGNFTSTSEGFYYRGDDQVHRHRASDTLSVDYGVTAADTGFETLIRGLKIAERVDVTDREGAQQTIDEALKLINDSIDRLPDIRGRIGGARAILEEETARLQDFTLALDESVSDIENVDFAEAVSRLGEEQAQMQASLAALARLRQVTLTSFL
ncbi:MAG: flagellin [Alphaproteobacteria bacterium]